MISTRHLFVIFNSTLILLGCSSQTEPPKYFESQKNYRSLANIETLLSTDDYKLHSCFDNVKKNCFSQFSFIEDSSNSEEYKHELAQKKKFHSCVLDDAIVCAYGVSNQFLVERINNLKKDFFIKQNEAALNWTKIKNYDPKQIMDLHYDFSKINSLFEDVKKLGSYDGFSIDNKDLISIPIGFHGIALKESNKITLYCRPQLIQDEGVGSYGRKFYKSSECKDPIDLKGQRLLLKLENGAEVIFEFDLKRFSKKLNLLNDKEKIDLNIASSELTELSNSKVPLKLSLELLIANNILKSNLDLAQKFLNIEKLASLERNIKYNNAKNLNLLNEVIGSSIDRCVLHTIALNRAEVAPLKSGLYLVKYGAFAGFDLNINELLSESAKIEILHPFLLSADKLTKIQKIADESLIYGNLIKKSCSSKNAFELDINFIEDEIY